MVSFFQISVNANEALEQVTDETGEASSTEVLIVEEEDQSQDLLVIDESLDQEAVDGLVENSDSLQATTSDVVLDLDQNYPIIIIPGVMGSNLYDSSSTFNRRNRIWAPDPFDNIFDVGMIFGIGSNMRMRNTLFPRPMTNMNVPGAHREYGALGMYQILVDHLIDVFPDREIFFFAHDFRLDNGVNASKLNTEIEQLLDGSGYDQVDVVAHSMGGLIISSYVAQYGTDSTRNIVTLGTPYEGAPQLLNGVLNGEISGVWVADLALKFLGGLNTDVKSEFPSVAQLMPTEAYFNEHPFYRFSHTTGFIFRTRHYRELSYTEYADMADSLFRWGTRRNFLEALAFHASIREDGLGILANYEHAYFVVGINQLTVSGIKFDGDGLFRNTPRVSDLIYEIYGDGTVPYDSQTMMRQLSGIERSNERVRKFETGHRAMVGDERVIAWAVDILNGNAATEVQSAQLLDRSFTVLRIEGFADVSIETPDGILTSKEDDLSIIAPFGRLDIIGDEGEIVMLALSDWEDHEVTLTVTGDGAIDYSIRWFDDENNLLDERIFADIAVNEGATITSSTAKDEITILEIDLNGNGIIDERWEAETNDFGSNAEVASLIVTDDFDDSDDSNLDSSNVVVLHHPVDVSERVSRLDDREALATSNINQVNRVEMSNATHHQAHQVKYLALAVLLGASLCLWQVHRRIKNKTKR